LTWLPWWLVGRVIGHKLIKGTPKDDSGQVWFKLARWFQRRRFLKNFTSGRILIQCQHCEIVKSYWHFPIISHAWITENKRLILQSFFIFKLARWFQRRRFLKNFTSGRRTTDDKWWQYLWVRWAKQCLKI
jgi:hypothetical protein